MPYKDPVRRRIAGTERMRKWRAANPEKAKWAYERDRSQRVWAVGAVRNQNLKRLYGITLEEWNTLFAGQGYRCAACKNEDPKTTRGWHTDHCHKTGEVRGILCQPCNIVAGYVEGDRRRLFAVGKYLSEDLQ